MFCRIYQWAIEKDLDDFGSVQRRHLAYHLQKCSHCRAYYHEMMQLGQQLRSAPTGELSDERLESIHLAMRQRLSETVPAQTASHTFRRPVHFRIRRVMSAAAAVVLVSLIGLYSFHYLKPVQPVDPLSQFAGNSAAFQNRISLLARLPEQPIQAEMYKLANDARAAMTFFADCIPASPIDINPNQKRNNSTP